MQTTARSPSSSERELSISQIRSRRASLTNGSPSKPKIDTPAKSTSSSLSTPLPLHPRSAGHRRSQRCQAQTRMEAQARSKGSTTLAMQLRPGLAPEHHPSQPKARPIILPFQPQCDPVALLPLPICMTACRAASPLRTSPRRCTGLPQPRPTRRPCTTSAAPRLVQARRSPTWTLTRPLTHPPASRAPPVPCLPRRSTTRLHPLMHLPSALPRAVPGATVLLRQCTLAGRDATALPIPCLLNLAIRSRPLPLITRSIP